MSTFVPAEPFPPGEYLQDELDARDWTQEDFSEITGISRRHIASIVAGKAGITAETAKAIAVAFKQDPATWMNLQVAYELSLAKVEDREIEKKAALLQLLPIRELKRRRWLPDQCTTDELEQAVCRLLMIESLSDKPQLCVAARKSGGYEFNNPAQLAWYFGVRHAAQSAPITTPYKQSYWQSGIEELLRLSTQPEDVRKVPSVLSDMGIRFLIVQHLKASKIDGVALWLTPTEPVIALSLRYDRLDNFWFSLLHELVHIKHKHASPVDEEIGATSDLPEIEQIANNEAANLLVPPEKMDSFVKRCGPSYYLARVVQFSHANDRHLNIIAGQLRHRGEIKHNQLTKLNAKVGEHIRGQALTDGWGDALNLGIR